MTEAPQAPAPAPAGPPVNPGKGLSIAGMVLGIVSIVVFCIPPVIWLSIVGAVVGLILSIIGRKKSTAANAPTGMATAGMVLCIIVLAIAVVIVILGLVGLAIFSAAASDMANDPNFQNLTNWISVF